MRSIRYLGERMSRIASTLLCIVVTVVAAGCGSNNTETEQPPPAHLTKAEARATMQDFYDDIDNGWFSSAWGSLSESSRNLIGSYRDWSTGHEGRTETDVEDIYVDRVARFDSLVHVDLRTVDEDQCGTQSVQYFTGTWRVLEKGSRKVITDPAMAFVRGDDPELAASECAEQKHERHLARQLARQRARERRLAAVEESSKGYGDDYENSYGYEDSYDDGGVDSTPEAADGSPSYEFEQDDIDRANDASEEVQDYCSGAVSEAQYVGCLSHVDEWDIP